MFQNKEHSMLFVENFVQQQTNRIHIFSFNYRGGEDAFLSGAPRQAMFDDDEVVGNVVTATNKQNPNPNPRPLRWRRGRLIGQHFGKGPMALLLDKLLFLLYFVCLQVFYA